LRLLAQRVPVDAARLIVRCARDVDDARGPALLDAVEEQPGEQVMAEVVRAERQLETILRGSARAGEARVVDQAVDRGSAREQLLGAAADRSQIGQVERDVLDLVVT